VVPTKRLSEIGKELNASRTLGTVLNGIRLSRFRPNYFSNLLYSSPSANRGRYLLDTKET